MIINAKNLPLSEITASTIPARNGNPAIAGFKVGGAWLNGSQDYDSRETLHAHLMGKEITWAASGKSLVVVGDFQPINTSFIKTILTAREQSTYVPVNLADLI